MADKGPSNNVPPVTPKSKSRENLDRHERANTGGDVVDRYRGQYSKNPPVREDPFETIY